MTSFIRYSCALLLFSTSTLHGQTTFTDPRDGKRYEIFQAGEHLWFRDNLQYRTPTSWCTQHPESEACELADFYFSTSLENVCPDNWRVPTWTEFKEVLTVLYDSVSFSLGDPDYFAEMVMGMTLIGDPKFNLPSIGMVEGSEYIPGDFSTLWVLGDPALPEPYPPHIHSVGDQTYKHAHKHHIIDRPRRIRRFVVRCVSDVK